MYLQSGGNPRLVSEMIERFADIHIDVDNSEETLEGEEKTGIGTNMAEHLTQRMDSVPAVVRSHLNLAAILGESFSARDVILVMEKYRGVADADKDEHAEFVRESLNEAVLHGILTAEASEGDVGASYKFSHQLWRKKILQLTLDSWQSEMRVLVQELLGHVKETAIMATSN